MNGQQMPPNKTDKFWESVYTGLGLGAGIAIGGALIVQFLPKYVKPLGKILRKA